MLCIIIGTRPQILKCFSLIEELKKKNIKYILVHTQQHYDCSLSKNNFTCLDMDEPDYYLNLKGNTSIEKISNMMIQLEKIIINKKINNIIVFGDCDTTFAGAFVAKKLDKYLIHIESGMRSRNMNMPEEINRILTDHISNLLFCSDTQSIKNLRDENIKNNLYYVGNLQIDLLKNKFKSVRIFEKMTKLNIKNNEFILMTIHRKNNSNRDFFIKLFNQIKTLDSTIIFVRHPRTKDILKKINIPNNIIILEPLEYLNMVYLMRECKCIITDSGGIQEEAHFLKKKCIIIRKETEWINALECGNNILYNFETPLKEFIEDFLKYKTICNHIHINSAEKIVNILLKKLF
tara:strand:- start:975 stop:2018 length:1044 start_codon:yes stop_codon:yes gene_type:complete